MNRLKIIIVSILLALLSVFTIKYCVDLIYMSIYSNSVEHVRVREGNVWTGYSNVKKYKEFSNGTVIIYLSNGDVIITDISNVIIEA